MRPAGSDTIGVVNETRAYASLLRMVAERLERLSADSKWAHRASGVRGQVLRTLDQLDSGENVPLPVVDGLIDTALDILRAAAREIA